MAAPASPMEGPADAAVGGVGAEVAAALAPVGAAAAGAHAPPPAAVAADARQRRTEGLTALRERTKDLKREQKRLRAEIKAQDQAHRRAVKKMRTLPTAAILQCLRERGEDV